MNHTDYQRLLLTHAVHAMACDGDIHAEEVAAIQRLVRSTPYFEDIDTAAETEGAVATLRSEGSGAIHSAVAALSDADLTAVQQKRLLEVVLSIIQADHVVEDTERAYVGSVRDALGLTTTDLVTNFPTSLSLLMSSSGEFNRDLSPSDDLSFDIAGLDNLAI